MTLAYAPMPSSNRSNAASTASSIQRLFVVLFSIRSRFDFALRRRRHDLGGVSDPVQRLCDHDQGLRFGHRLWSAGYFFRHGLALPVGDPSASSRYDRSIALAGSRAGSTPS